MHRADVQLHLLQRARQLFGLQLRRRENNRFRPRRPGEQFADNSDFLVFVTYVSHLADRLVGFGYGDVHLGRIAQDLFGQLPDFRRKRRREHHGLPLGGQLGDDLHNIVEESHIEHPIGLVEHEIAHVRQIHPAVLNMGQQASGRSDHDVGAHDHPLFLLTPADTVATAVNDRRRKG